MTRLNAKDENFCSYTALFGILIAATCLIQHIIYGLAVWLLFTVLILYLLIAACFAILALKKWYAPVALIVSCVLSAGVEVIHALTVVRSPISMILFVYSLTITIYVYVEGMPVRLAKVAAAKRAEQDEWKDRI
jgi:hypothetical protein